MNNRESKEKVSKNQFKEFVEKRIALKKKEIEKKVPTAQQLEKKALAYQLFLQQKGHLKRLKTKNHRPPVDD
jgi:hypothetical protein